MILIINFMLGLAGFALLPGDGSGPGTVAQAQAWRLLPAVQVHSDGVYLNELVDDQTNQLPHVLLAPSPALGKTLVWTRTQVAELVHHTSPELAPGGWTGALQVRITRQTRMLEEAEVKAALTKALQEGFVKERGDLELRFTRPWRAVTIADEPFTVNILDLPQTGVAPNFVVRFELRAGSDLLGNWQMPLQAHLWREILVAGSPLARGELLQSADVVKERRDVLGIREPLAEVNQKDASLELADALPTGAPLLARALKVRPVVRRGRVVDAVVEDGLLVITVKAEVLEDGVPGQTVRARNVKSRREFRGKVEDEDTIQVAL